MIPSWRRYDAFGNITDQKADYGSADRYAYVGREWDTFTGLQYNRARMYDPQIGRWYSADPMGFDAGDVNLYRYVSNGYVNATDPSGYFYSYLLDAGSRFVRKTFGKGSPADKIADGIAGFARGIDLPRRLIGDPIVESVVSIRNAYINEGLSGAADAYVMRLIKNHPLYGMVWKMGEDTLGNWARGNNWVEAYLGSIFKNTPGLTNMVWRFAEGIEGQEFGGLKHGDKLEVSARVFRITSSVVDFLMVMLPAKAVAGTSGVRPANLNPNPGINLNPQQLNMLRGNPGKKMVNAFEQPQALAPLAGVALALQNGNDNNKNPNEDKPENENKSKPCFAAGTRLLTATGYKPIEQFQVGDMVLSRSEWATSDIVEEKVVEEVMRRVAPIVHVHVGGQVIRTTANHPFYVAFKGWLEAGNLGSGDQVLSHDGRWSVVEEVFDTGEWEVVYNLSISDHHTYFVGCDDWGFSVWAHNACVSIYKAPTAGRGGKQFISGYDATDLTVPPPWGNGKLYFAKDRWIADTYAAQGPYGEGVIETQIDEKEYNAHLKIYEQVYVGSNIHKGGNLDTGVELAVPASAWAVINKGTRIWYP